MSVSAPGGAAALSLLHDGALRLEAAPDLRPLLARWLPLLPYDSTPAAAGGAAIRVARRFDDGFGAGPAPAAPPVLRLGSVDAWVEGEGATLRGAAGCAGRIGLAAGTAALAVPRVVEDADAAGWDLYSMLTLSAALLLGRMGRALVHAAAVVAPGGGAWLLAGDTHAGKSTTSVNLISAGWDFVSDDHVVLFGGAGGGVWVEGWPRRFHLDEGWESGAPGRPRGEVDPHARWPGRWRRTAPLAGVLFPRVSAAEPTALAPAPAADALAGLLRQSPWLLADRAAAPAVLGLLHAACGHPAFALRLGLDTYRDTGRLVRVLGPLVAG
ncbi:MAG TPA: hypothetical protein VHG91_09440 [Longimicrobium sp.]|nr:hypothetical protein [Longimicrobium sp.]